MIEQFLENVPLIFHAFGIFATITLVGALGVAFSKNIIYSAFSLLGTFFGVVGLFVLLSADFLAIVQLMVYVGGILVLILFAVMLTNNISHINHSNPIINRPIGIFLLLSLFFLLLKTIFDFDWKIQEQTPFVPTTNIIGDAFLSRYILPFEVAGLMLLITLIAAVVVARKEIK